MNLYGFVGNAGINAYDILGLEERKRIPFPLPDRDWRPPWDPGAPVPPGFPNAQRCIKPPGSPGQEKQVKWKIVQCWFIEDCRLKRGVRWDRHYKKCLGWGVEGKPGQEPWLGWGGIRGWYRWLDRVDKGECAQTTGPAPGS